MSKKSLCFLVFGFSGFSGVMYESLWSHYLKLFLGHAAYAQMLVLMIFMGGMAIGAIMAAQRGAHIRNPLLYYALAEAIIGVFALLFHPLYVFATDLSYQIILPQLHLPVALHVYKWALASLLIVPQSILLGTTFPLMSSGLLRAFPEKPGQTLAILYFTNSLGGALGVLVCGYVLLGAAGYPGTMAIAGMMNLAIAAAVWALDRQTSNNAQLPIDRANPGEPSAGRTFYGFLAVSAFTGASSFMYEIGWIRMLGMVVGTYAHAFELMLSAFILGLAMGSLIIRRKIDSLIDRRRALGLIQLAMGLLALATIVMYNATFDWMGALYASLGRLAPESRYFLLQLSSQGIALAIMLPATICAGMTLPLITRHLLATRYGEKSIGAVYAANTLGAIVGVVLSVQVVLPLLGLRNLMLIGGAIDMAIGVVLFVGMKQRIPWAPIAGAFSLAVVGCVAFSPKFDTKKMSALVLTDANSNQFDKTVLFHKDGKTATVDVIRYDQDGAVGISTNGMSVGFLGSESNLITLNSTLLAAIPLAMTPNARTVATFGVGTGYNARVFLADPGIQSVDIIEIEEQMYEGAKHLGAWVAGVYADPRCHLYVEDAKSFFSWKNAQYDIVVADISYVWVSGVAGLFSKEFYHLIRRHISPSGLFVQWMHPTSMPLLASIMKALGESFRDYSIFHAGYFMIIVAGENASFERITDAPFAVPGLSGFLHDNGLDNREDFRMQYLGNRASLDPLFQSYAVAANSDYHPLLDLQAFKVKILDQADSFDKLHGLRHYAIPVIDILENRRRSGVSPRAKDGAAVQARVFYDHVTKQTPLPQADSMEQKALAILVNSAGPGVTASAEVTARFAYAWITALEWLWTQTASYLTNDEMETLLQVIRSRADFHALPSAASQLWTFLSALNRGNFQTVYDIATAVLAQTDRAQMADSWQLPAALVAAVQLQDDAAIGNMLSAYQVDDAGDVGLRLLYAKARQWVSRPSPLRETNP